ncbi:hypothetical protein BT63DRAFT_419680 [Microthyrium microscopicum]|uniref:Actin binding protein n=1 Tax=Microthyrium microscopicum TaxID=703497 RepID=A0A6A6USJ8_9PEZI|nr:hypothetical protein BT63DRAFT_419680 [Microthyrium microscopicum]
MASLNLSTNGPSITKSYQSVLNSPPPSGPAGASPTYGQWAIFTVQAPLVSAFQNDGSKESVMKVQSTGEGELVDFVEDFSDGRIQFGFVKVKDPNTTLPKCVLVGWCGEGVPERTKGYFTSHLNTVSKVFQGYHIQITARSDSDIAPERIIQKVSDASGSKYSGGGDVPAAAIPKPPAGSKPVFLPTRVGSSASGFNPLGSRARASPSGGAVDEDGWGADAPPVTRTQLEKVASAYNPTKVNLADLTFGSNNGSGPDVVRGAYQPIGKVDIAEIRRQARGADQDNRPTPVKGAYEPIGKVDIAAIRAKAQGPGMSSPPPAADVEEDEAPRSLADRSSSFQQSERLTTLPKPKVANKFGGGSTFTGTRAPAPSEFSRSGAAAAPVGAISKTFADEGGKTPAQIWAEKKARQGGGVISPSSTGAGLQSQKSGDGWKSSYTGKSWGAVPINRTGQSTTSNKSDSRPGNNEQEEPEEQSESLSSIRNKFANAPPPPAMDMSSKPTGSSRPIPPPVEEDEEEYRSSSPIRVAMPVARGAEPEQEEEPPLPIASVNRAVAESREMPPEPQVEAHDPARGAGMAAAESTFGPGAASAQPGANKGGKRALVQYDYEKAEPNEIELKENEYVINIDMVDEDWWMGENAAGEVGLFPANYVEIVEDEEPAAAEPTTSASASASKKPTATAQYDYEAAEENELSFPDGAKVINVEFPDDDWWFGEFNGKSGLFPANYVQLDE